MKPNRARYIPFISALGAFCFACEAEDRPPDLPAVVMTVPSEGEERVAIDTLIRVGFDRRMNTERGQISLSNGVVLNATDGGWANGGRTAAFALPGALPAHMALQMDVSGFESAGGVKTAETLRVHFQTGADAAGPFVVAIDPPHESAGLATSATVTVTFSEPMYPERGTCTVGQVISSGNELRWSDDRLSFTFTPTSRYELLSRIGVTVGDDFVSTDGRKIARPFHSWFETRDDLPPVLWRASLRDGDEVSVRELTALVLTASEPLAEQGTVFIAADSELATQRLIVEPPTIAGDTIYVRLGGLSERARYEVRLEGFADRAGNPLDLSLFGSDGTLSFSTNDAISYTAPVLVWSWPQETAANVDPTLDKIELEFSEPMADAAVYMEIFEDAILTTISAEVAFAPDRRFATIAVDGLLRRNAQHRLHLETMRSVFGPSLNGGPWLRDGALDFATGADLRAPRVVTADPPEGASDVYPVDVDYVYVDFVGRNGTLHRKVITLLFDEVMDRNIAHAALECVGCMEDDGSGTPQPIPPIDLTGVWSEDSRTLVFIVPDGTFFDPASSAGAPLMPNASLRLDLRNLRDRFQNGLEQSSYLVDGWLDLETSALDTELNHTCTHFLGRSPLQSISAGAEDSNPFSLPLSGTPHGLNVISLPLLEMDGSWRGFVRHDPGALCSTRLGRTTLYFDRAVSVRLRSSSGSFELTPIVEAAPPACPEAITHRARFVAPSEGLLDPLVVELSAATSGLEYVVEALDPELGCGG